MGPKGYVLLKREFTATKLWPGKVLSLNDGWLDLEKQYKEALAGQLVVVMDISVTDDGYFVLGKSKATGDFLWMIEKEDTVKGSFMPLIWKYGTLMPAGLSAVEEFKWLASSLDKSEINQYKKP